MAGGKLISTGVEFPDATTQTTSALPLTGGTMTGTIAGFTSTGIDDNATSTAITTNSDGSVELGVVGVSNDSIKTYSYGNTKKALIVGRDSGSGSRLQLTYDSAGTENAYLSRFYTNSELHFDMNGVDHLTIDASGNFDFNGGTFSNVGDNFTTGTATALNGATIGTNSWIKDNNTGMAMCFVDVYPNSTTNQAYVSVPSGFYPKQSIYAPVVTNSNSWDCLANVYFSGSTMLLYPQEATCGTTATGALFRICFTYRII